MMLSDEPKEAAQFRAVTMKLQEVFAEQRGKRQVYMKGTVSLFQTWKEFV